MSTYPVLSLQYAMQPKQLMTAITTGIATNKVLARLKELAEFLADCRWGGLRVVLVCTITWFGGVPDQIIIFRY